MGAAGLIPGLGRFCMLCGVAKKKERERERKIITNVGEDVEKLNPSADRIHCWWDCKMVQGNSLAKGK